MKAIKNIQTKKVTFVTPPIKPLNHPAIFTTPHISQLLLSFGFLPSVFIVSFYDFHFCFCFIQEQIFTSVFEYKMNFLLIKAEMCEGWAPSWSWAGANTPSV